MAEITNGTWTADELMHGKAGSPPTSPTSESPTKQGHNRFSMRKMGGGKKPPADPMDWGMPGHLTEEEVAIFVSCRIIDCVVLVLVLVH